MNYSHSKKKEDGRRKMEEGRWKKSLVISHQCCRLRAFRTTSSGRRKKEYGIWNMK
ncbi:MULTISPECIES: hypothetical protein [unclassified Microcoleus]|uniref:hypothetical protein n=1 Tax=unclassified Microcoleus TaxID=2642155 RepID=UPI002FD1E09C